MEIIFFLQKTVFFVPKTQFLDQFSTFFLKRKWGYLTEFLWRQFWGNPVLEPFPKQQKSASVNLSQQQLAFFPLTLPLACGACFHCRPIWTLFVPGCTSHPPTPQPPAMVPCRSAHDTTKSIIQSLHITIDRSSSASRFTQSSFCPLHSQRN